jgi:O-antigen/teichoic acid export membrane protein
MHDLKSKTVRAGIINVGSKGFGFVIRIASIMILGRLLDPTDYGLFTMVIAFTGVLSIFAGFGLFHAAVQRSALSEDDSTSLFWMNVVFGGFLTLMTIAAAPFVSQFYHEPRLVPVTQVVGASFIITSAGIQHSVLLHRRMLFGVKATIESISLLIGTVVSIGMAMTGYGYWALVSITITLPLANTVGFWIATGWIPGRPMIAPQSISMLRFGFGATMTGFFSYLTGNVDKLLIGRALGTEALGLYARAFNLSNFPGDNLNATIGEVAFAALSRAKDEPERFRRYFLKCHSLVVTLSLPLTIVCALFADDLVIVVLGPKWASAAEVFLLLAPTILVIAIMNPLGWLLNALGLIRRGLYIGAFNTPLVITAVLIGLPYGPTGVAAAYSAVMVMKLIPVCAWALRGTGIRLRDILASLTHPLAASAAATAVVFATRGFFAPVHPAALRLVLELSLFGAVYVPAMLLFEGQRALYLDLFRTAKATPPA